MTELVAGEALAKGSVDRTEPALKGAEGSRAVPAPPGGEAGHRVVCAWCPDFNPADPANAGASHGICPDCAARVAPEWGL
jgi:hypothetical protein